MEQMRFLHILGGGVVGGKSDNAGAGLEGGASRAAIGRILDGARIGGILSLFVRRLEAISRVV